VILILSTFGKNVYSPLTCLYMYSNCNGAFLYRPTLNMTVWSSTQLDEVVANF